ncbi:MAG: hypothetical protein Q8Q04_03630 [archaeon]|nr:hypothetical protein [archaeon]
MTNQLYHVKNEDGENIRGNYDSTRLYDSLREKYDSKRIPFIPSIENYSVADLLDFEGVSLILANYRYPAKILLIGPNKDCLDNTVMKISNDFKGRYKFDEVKE